MRDEEIECPRCGQPWEGNPNSPFWTEARYRAEGRAHTAATPAEEAQNIPGGLCGLCGARLPETRQKRKIRAPHIPTVLPADPVDEVEVVEEKMDAEAITALPTAGSPPSPQRAARPALPAPHAQTPPLRRLPSVPESRPSAPRFLGLSLYVWIPLVLGVLALLVIVPLAIFLIVYAVRGTSKHPPAVHEPPPASNYPGLLAYWSFDEGAGAEAADSSGNGQHARLVHAGWTGGIRGKALHCSGADSYLDYSAAPRLSFAAQASFTFAFWTRTTRGDGTLLSQRNSRTGGPVIDVLLRGGRVQAQVRQDGNDVLGPAILDGGVVNDGAWHHVALVREGNRIELFLDAVAQGQTRNNQASGAITTDFRALGSERYWNQRNAPFGDPHFQGDMDEFCVFGRVLKAEEIKALAGR